MRHCILDTILIVILSFFSISNLTACPPPDCDDCYEGENCADLTDECALYWQCGDGPTHYCCDCDTCQCNMDRWKYWCNGLHGPCRYCDDCECTCPTVTVSMSPSPPFYTGQEVTFTATLSPSELSGDCKSQISWTYTSEIGDVVTTVFNYTGTNFREYAVLGSGCPLGVSPYFDVYGVDIIKPLTKADVSPDSNVFHTSTPYCYHNQAVASGNLGTVRVQEIQGSVSPSASYQWTLDVDAGSISPTAGSLTPTHSSPTTAGSGTLKLALTSNPNIFATTTIEVYEDHLARDVANFKHGKACKPSVELADGSFVSGLSMGCSVTANHAWRGESGSGTYIRTNLQNKVVVSKEPWAQFVSRNLSRGYILELCYGATKSSAGFRHWQTVKSSGSGASAQTYAGDAVGTTGIFRHETVDSYYDDRGYPNESYRWVTVYNPD